MAFDDVLQVVCKAWIQCYRWTGPTHRQASGNLPWLVGPSRFDVRHWLAVPLDDGFFSGFDLVQQAGEVAGGSYRSEVAEKNGSGCLPGD
jgi:hypothetical protein